MEKKYPLYNNIPHDIDCPINLINGVRSNKSSKNPNVNIKINPNKIKIGKESELINKTKVIIDKNIPNPPNRDFGFMCELLSFGVDNKLNLFDI